MHPFSGIVRVFVTFVRFLSDGVRFSISLLVIACAGRDSWAGDCPFRRLYRLTTVLVFSFDALVVSPLLHCWIVLGRKACHCP